MRISKKSRYGVRMMLELALDYGKGYIFLKEIARRQEISEKYLSQIVLVLKSRGLVVSSRGARGGHMLSRPPAEISIKDIVESLEGDPGIVDCVRNPSICEKTVDCAAAKLWRDLEKAVSDTLASKTLDDLVKYSKKRKNKNAGKKKS